MSDLHLDAAAPAAIAQFIAFLQAPATRAAAALYILGDLFEVWLGDDDDDPARCQVIDALRELTASGVPGFILHGNRDFLYAAQFESRSGCQVLGDPVIATLEGQRVLLTHGDLLCTDDAAYQLLRATVRDTAWQQRFVALSLAQRSALAGAARSGSKAHMQKAAPAIMDVNPDAVATVFRAADVDWMIHGHTHRPAHHRLQIDGRLRHRIVLDAWYDGGSYLEFAAGEFNARRLPG